MNDVRVNDFVPVITRLFSCYPNARFDKEIMGAYIEFLCDIPLDHLEIVINQCKLESPDFVPPAGRIKRRYLEMIQPKTLTADEAWGQVTKQILRVGHIGQPEFEDSLTARIVKNMGWRDLCMSENAMADRAHFIKLYSQAVEQVIVRSGETKATRLLTERAQLERKGLQQIGSMFQLTEGDE